MPGTLNPNQNLIRQVSAEQVERPSNFYLLIILDVITVAAAAALSLLYRLFIGGRVALWELFLASGLFLILSVFEILLTKKFSRRFFLLVV